MTLVEDAVEELYAGDLDQFTARRTQLAAAAKKSGDRDAAAAITALRKPTQAAFTINRLARTDPEAIDDLVQLGAELQRAQRSSDASTLRDLNRQRRTVLSELAARAFDIVGQQAPSAGQREEVAATLQAALADPELAQRLRSATLVKAAESSGFGFTTPELTLVGAGPRPPARAPRDGAAPKRSASRTPAASGRSSGAVSNPADQVSGAAAERAAKAERADARQRAADAAAERRKKARAKAQQEVETADTAVDEAIADIDATKQTIRQLQRQLGEAKRHLEIAQKTAKDAESRQRKARQGLHALSRAGGSG